VIVVAEAASQFDEIIELSNRCVYFTFTSSPYCYLMDNAISIVSC